MAGREREYATVVIVALLVIASGSVTSVGGGQPNAADPEGDATGLVVDELLTRFAAGEEADAVYVDRSGDAVFRYGNDHAVTAIPIQGRLGMEAGTGLAHASYAGDLERVTLHGQEADANATLWATPASITGTADVVLDDPTDVESLSADLRRTRTDETNAATVGLTAAVTNDTRRYAAIETQGRLETTATTISASGSLRTRVANGTDTDAAPPSPDERREVTITERDGAIRLEASERRTVGEWERERWATEADARRSLESRYGELAIALGGQADLSLDSYAYENDSERDAVELEYTVSFTDVEDGLAERLTRELRNSSAVDLDEHEARVIADRLATATLEEVSVTVVRRGPETELEWDVELSGTDEIVLGIAEIAGANERVSEAQVDPYGAVETDLEAQRAANLVTETTWNASLEHDRAANRTVVDVVADADARNWRAYSAEREARALGPIPRTTGTVTAELADGDIEASAEYETSREEIGPIGIEELLRFSGRDVGPRIEVAIGLLTDTEFEVARANAAVDDGSVAIESAASFDDVSFETVAGDGDVRGVHAATTNERTNVYVTAESAFETEPTDRGIRDHYRVGPATDVYGPGEWDREFPSLDSDAVRGFLEIGDDEATAEDRTAAAVVPPMTVAIGAVVLGTIAAGGVLWLSGHRGGPRRRE